MSDHQSFTEAYKQGVMETAENGGRKFILIDPDNMNVGRNGPKDTHRITLGDRVEEAVKEQFPNAKSITNGDLGNRGEVALKARFQNTPFVEMGHLKVDGEDYDIISLPSRKVDSKEEYIKYALKGTPYENKIDEITKNTPGTDEQWARYMGNHEGAHVGRSTFNDHVDWMREEAGADIIAYKLARERGEGDIALAAKDIRALKAGFQDVHAANVVGENEQIEEHHLKATGNSDLEYKMFKELYSNNQDIKPQELLEKDPDAYFALGNKILENDAEQVLQAYKNDPESLRAQKDIMKLQAETNSFQSFEGAYRRRILGQDVPEEKPVQYISQDAVDKFYENKDLFGQIEAQKQAYSFEGQKEYSIFKIDMKALTEDQFEEYSKDPRAFHLKVLEQESQELLAKHEAAPTNETTEQLIKLEGAINDARENVHGNDFERAVLIPESEKEAFIIKQIKSQEEAPKLETQDNASASIEMNNLTGFDFSNNDSEFQGDNTIKINAIAALDQINIQTSGINTAEPALPQENTENAISYSPLSIQ